MPQGIAMKVYVIVSRDRHHTRWINVETSARAAKSLVSQLVADGQVVARTCVNVAAPTKPRARRKAVG